MSAAIITKPVVHIYLAPDKQSTKIVVDFIAKHIDRINQQLEIKMIKVTAKNIEQVKGRGIRQTPTLVYNQKRYIGIEKITRILTPPDMNRDHFGYGNTSAEDLVHQYQDAILDTGDDDGGESEQRGEALRQKMAAFQKKRPEMLGVDSRRSLKGGRKIKAGGKAKKEFIDDDDFRHSAGADNIETTPAAAYFEDTDGDRILEDYFNDEADKEGRKIGKVISKRR